MRIHPIVRTKKFFSDHRVGLAVLATAIVVTKVNQLTQPGCENFSEDPILESHTDPTPTEEI